MHASPAAARSWRSGSAAARDSPRPRAPARPPAAPHAAAPRTWTRRPPCSLRARSEDSASGGLRRLQPAAARRLHSSILGPSTRYGQPCTSCLKTQGRERAREDPVLAEWREGRRPAGRRPRGLRAAEPLPFAPWWVPSAGTRRASDPRELAPRGPASRCRPPGHQPSAHGALPFPAPAEVSPPHMLPKSIHYRLPPRAHSAVCLPFHRFLSSPPPPLGKKKKTALGKV